MPAEPSSLVLSPAFMILASAMVLFQSPGLISVVEELRRYRLRLPNFEAQPDRTVGCERIFLVGKETLTCHNRYIDIPHRVRNVKLYFLRSDSAREQRISPMRCSTLSALLLCYRSAYSPSSSITCRFTVDRTNRLSRAVLSLTFHLMHHKTEFKRCILVGST